MNSRTIGKITSIGIRGIIADVYDDLGNYINTMDGIYFVGEMGHMFRYMKLVEP